MHITQHVKTHVTLYVNMHVTQHVNMHVNNLHVTQYGLFNVNLPSIPPPQLPRYAGLVLH